MDFSIEHNLNIIQKVEIPVLTINIYCNFQNEDEHGDTFLLLPVGKPEAASVVTSDMFVPLLQINGKEDVLVQVFELMGQTLLIPVLNYHDLLENNVEVHAGFEED